MIEATIVASTKEGHIPEKNELFTLGGKFAGECYMEGRYSDPSVSSDDKGFARASMTAKSGHHSVFDPTWVSIELFGIPKMGAMILNSLGFYSTQEKSARYTKMKPQTELEEKVYEKWIGKFSDIIAKTYTDMLPTDEMEEKDTKKCWAAIEKLAQENARYGISVFTPSSMVYSTSNRQWNYIIDWLKDLGETLATRRQTEPNINIKMFNSNIIGTLADIVNAVSPLIAEDNIYDNKGRKLDFLAMQVDAPAAYITEEHFGDSYTAIYKGSLAHLAQAQRHKTIDYHMQFNGEATEFFVPPIIEGTSYETEWLEDMQSIAYCTPQGTMVTIVERGTAENFILKAQERLCGRAQLEIAQRTAQTHLKLVESEHVSIKSRSILGKFVQDDKIVPRCGTDMYKCSEGCRWGKKYGLDRSI